jgi:hypothetical protein
MRVADRAAYEPAGLLPEVEVVLGEVERALRAGDELRHLARNLERRLAAVGQSA